MIDLVKVNKGEKPSFQPEKYEYCYKLVKDNHYSPEQARVVATKNIEPDKLSGDKKAQMEER